MQLFLHTTKTNNYEKSKTTFFGILLLFLLAFWTTSNLQGQETQLVQTVRGTVLDQDSQAPLMGVTVWLIGSSIGTTTDLDGNYRLPKVPIGRHQLKFSYLGYESFTRSNIEVNSTKEVILNVALQEKFEQLETVEVSASMYKTNSINEMTTVSARQFTVEEAGRYAGSRNEPSRMAANYAGVSGASDARNDIVIRGNSPTGLLWRFEGIDIPNPNHFSSVGSNGGAVSILNYNVLSNSDFLTGAFPSEYGNALSGVFDINMRNGNNENREYMFMVGSIGPEILVEGPFSKDYDGSYLFNYRYSTTYVMTEMMHLNIGWDGEPVYQDAAFKIKLPTSKLGTFSIFGMGGISTYTINQDDRTEESFDPVIAANTNRELRTRMGAIGLSHQYLIDEKTYIKTVFGVSGTGEETNTDSIGISETNTLFIPYQRALSEATNYSLHSYLGKKLNARNKIKAGLIIDHKRFDIQESFFSREAQQLAQIRSGNGNTTLTRAYVQWQNRWTSNLTLNAGLHGQYLFLNESMVIEPRVGLKWQYKPNQSLSIAYGLHSQLQSLPVYFTVDPTGNLSSNENLGFSRSHHFVLGYDYNFKENWRLKLEGYYQRLFDIPIQNKETPSSFSLLNEGGDFLLPDLPGLVNGGIGQNYGVELTLEKFFHDGYYLLFTGSIFDSQYQGSDGEWRNTVFNGQFIFNALMGREFKVGKKDRIIFDFKTTYAGGRRFTPFDLEASVASGLPVQIDNEAFSQQHPNYFRTDIKFTYRMNRKRFSHEAFFNLDNVFNTQNIFSQIFDPTIGGVRTINQLGLLPSFQYKVEF